MAVLSQGGHQELQLHFRHCEGFGCPPLRVRGAVLGRPLLSGCCGPCHLGLGPKCPGLGQLLFWPNQSLK